MCGVFGVRATDRDVARLTYFGLFALQHRGQEAAGIAVSDRGRVTTLRDLGLVTQVFDEAELREELREREVKLASTSDSEVIAALIANDDAPLEEAVASAMARLEGAFSVTALSEGKLVAFRDPHGFRPLVLGRLGADWVVASETCALDLLGAAFERELERGELVVIDESGCRARRGVEPQQGALCIFEF